MKAIAWTKYGGPDVLKLKEFKKPVPNKNEVLIKVFASTVTAGDVGLRSLKVPRGFRFLTQLAFGLTKPRKPILGMDFSGEVESIGGDVTLFKKGDKVYGTTGAKLGANAEYICIPQKSAVVKKPSNVTHEQAVAVIFGGLTAIHFLKDSVKIQPGQKLLINGASGAVGTAAIQLAKYFGADVTGICSTSNIELIESLGADIAVDYTKIDVSQNNQKYDVILDATGNFSLAGTKNLLTKDGKLIQISADLTTILSSIFQAKLVCGVAAESKEALEFLKERVEAEEIKAVIDRTYPLEQTAEAHRYVDTGRKKGNVVITIKLDSI
jgi:NADPH:quinone reductase-like Zn-dependent oxidoreductase